MIPLYSTSQIRAFDKFATESLGVPGMVLMENAAIGIVEAINEKISLSQLDLKFGIVCGKGNNGGDGYAVARHLSNAGQLVKVISIGKESELSDDCKTNYIVTDKLSKTRKNLTLKKFKSVKDLKFLSDCNVIIDAIFGTGISGNLKSPYSEIIEQLNRLKVFKIAIDVPSGLNADTGYAELAFKAHLTITLGGYKKGLFISSGSDFSGDIELKDIGVGNDFFESQTVHEYLYEPEDCLESLPVKEKPSHKYSAGKALVIAGSEKYPGAALLTSQAAFKSGCGSVLLAVPSSIRKKVLGKVPEIVFADYDSPNGCLSIDSIKVIWEKIEWSEVVAIGPGLGREESSIEAVQYLLKKRKNKKFVIDADAIFAIGDEQFKEFNLTNCVLTPHLAEFAQLINIPIEKIKQDVISYGRGFAVQTGSYLVLKGAPTITFLPNGEVIINSSGNPGMAKFGTGDALTGMIASFIAQTNKIEESVLSAVYLHSLSADLQMKNKTEFSYSATDIIKNIPTTIKFLRNSFD